MVHNFTWETAEHKFFDSPDGKKKSMKYFFSKFSVVKSCGRR